MTSAGEEGGVPFIEARHQTVAVKLDLVEPFTNSRYRIRERRELR
jgi:hypothetical protein